MSKGTQVFSIVAAVLILSPAFVFAAKQTSVVVEKPPSVSKIVAKPLMAAQAFVKAEKWQDCLKSVLEAEALPNKTPYEVFVVGDMLGYCGAKSADNVATLRGYESVIDSGLADKARTGGLLKGLMQITYNKKDYSKAIEYGNRSIRDGYADEDVYVVIAQAFYIQSDYKNTRSKLETWFALADQPIATERVVPREATLQLYLSSCIKLSDDSCTLAALERTVANYPKADNWLNLVGAIFRSSSNDKSLLNVYRLAKEVGAVRRSDDFLEMAQLAIDQGLPGEAQSAIESGLEAKAFESSRDLERAQRLLITAKTQAATDRSTLARQDKDASTAKTGTADIKLAQAYISYGDFVQAVATVQRGITKGGLKTPNEAHLTLGIAQLRAGKKSEALVAFKGVQGDAATLRLARLWGFRASSILPY